MSEETKVANKLQEMMTWNLVPVSAQEDIKEICNALNQGKVNLAELEDQDPFVVEILHQAKNEA
ncbi:hypothetical protein D3H55_13890 [Bacillus salacetis]|uniref:Uncharacterized protein n=1 Tax=Bacillus salacetis TaxID=2315464 RepID=A0A3A1QWH3_9BACI|nr:hypothetical protein [Bacillus salacetis]RIW31971.1 hypothetical protein D3H55_13890 [Bacillus salacetis]